MKQYIILKKDLRLVVSRLPLHLFRLITQYLEFEHLETVKPKRVHKLHDVLFSHSNYPIIINNKSKSSDFFPDYPGFFNCLSFSLFFQNYLFFNLTLVPLTAIKNSCYQGPSLATVMNALRSIYQENWETFTLTLPLKFSTPLIQKTPIA